MFLSSAVMWLSLLCRGWMCGSLCLVIRTVNDRDAWRDRERAGGGLVAMVGVEGVSWRFEPYQGFTAGHNSMCGDCVEGLASRARASPLRTVVHGGRGFHFQSFSPPSCGLLDVFVLRAKVNLNRKKKEKLHGTVHVWPLPSPPPFHLFYFLVFYVLAACSVIRKFKNWQHWGIYILANFSNGFLTRKHILQFLSILVFLRLSVAVSLTTSPGLLQIILLHKSPPGPSVFLFSLHSQQKDCICVDPKITPWS